MKRKPKKIIRKVTVTLPPPTVGQAIDQSSALLARLTAEQQIAAMSALIRLHGFSVKYES